MKIQCNGLFNPRAEPDFPAIKSIKLIMRREITVDHICSKLVMSLPGPQRRNIPEYNDLSTSELRFFFYGFGLARKGTPFKWNSSI